MVGVRSRVTNITFREVKNDNMYGTVPCQYEIRYNLVLFVMVLWPGKIKNQNAF